MDKNSVLKLNLINRINLINKILASNGDYRLYCIDVDDVVFDTESVVQEILREIDYRSTNEYRSMVSGGSSEDSRDATNKSYDILDAILEESEYTEYDEEQNKVIKRKYPQIDYDKIYNTVKPISGSIEFIRHMLNNRRENDFFIFLSHRNPEREGIAKLQKLYELFPEIDAIETIPFHVPGTKDVMSKALHIRDTYGLETLENCYLIDNSKKNCLDFRMNGGTDIRFLPQGYNSDHVVTDHMSKLTSLDPFMIQLCLSYIEYARKNPNCYHERIAKTKKKK